MYSGYAIKHVLLDRSKTLMYVAQQALFSWQQKAVHVYARFYYTDNMQ